MKLLKDITNFENKSLNGWVPRLSEKDAAGAPNWYFSDSDTAMVHPHWFSPLRMLKTRERSSVKALF